MKIGLCVSVNDLPLVALLGYDYPELPLCSVAGMSDEDFSLLKENIKKFNINEVNFNLLLPQGFKILGNDVSEKDIADYVEIAFRRASQINGKIAVFGSGGARRLPEGVCFDAAMKQLEKACLVFSETAEKYGMTIVFEPLNSKETDLVNTVSDGLELVKRVNHKSFMLLADFYHMQMENESLDVIVKSAEYLKHCHIAIGRERRFPKQQDSRVIESFLAPLREISFSGGLSVEGISGNLAEDARESLELLKHI